MRERPRGGGRRSYGGGERSRRGGGPRSKRLGGGPRSSNRLGGGPRSSKRRGGPRSSKRLGPRSSNRPGGPLSSRPDGPRSSKRRLPRSSRSRRRISSIWLERPTSASRRCNASCSSACRLRISLRRQRARQIATHSFFCSSSSAGTLSGESCAESRRRQSATIKGAVFASRKPVSEICMRLPSTTCGVSTRRPASYARGCQRLRAAPG